MSKVLIIKVGYSETLDPEISNVTSYGDVLRSTVLLNLFKNDLVTWLVDAKAYPILKNNPYIHRVLIYDLTSVLQLQAEHFDTVINLEKVPGLCALADSIKAWRRFGFRFEERNGEAEAYDGSHIVLDICKDIEKKQNRKACWQEGLFDMVGAKWDGEEYITGYRPKTKETYDVGFNHQVGNKWPLKAWPQNNWKNLETLIGDKYSVSWQEGLESIEKYIEWINSCKLIITNDSFGLHIALALKKKLITLHGPSSHYDNYLYGLGTALYPNGGFSCEKFPCSPYQMKQCIKFNDTCMSLITPERVLEEINKLLNVTGDCRLETGKLS